MINDIEVKRGDIWRPNTNGGTREVLQIDDRRLTYYNEKRNDKKAFVLPITEFKRWIHRSNATLVRGE